MECCKDILQVQNYCVMLSKYGCLCVFQKLQCLTRLTCVILCDVLSSYVCKYR